MIHFVEIIEKKMEFDIEDSKIYYTINVNMLKNEGIYKLIGDTRVPPSLVTHITDSIDFNTIVKRIDKEAFLKIRNEKGNFSQIRISSMGDSSFNTVGNLDSSNCELDLRIYIENIEKDILEKVRNSPLWWFIIKNRTAKKVLSFTVEKNSGKIIKRELIET